MIVYEIDIPKRADAEAFANFMRDEYFPAIHKGPTRVGQVTNLVLLQAEPVGNAKGCKFFLHVGWSGLPMGVVSVDDPAIAGKLEAFKVNLKRIGVFREAASWHPQHLSPEASSPNQG